MIAQKPILHLVLLNLKPAPGKAPVDDLLAAFGRLAEIDGVLHLGAARAASDDSTHSLAMFALLRDSVALEEFGTHPRHIEYLQTAVLPRVSDLVTADVVVAGGPPGRARTGPRLGAAVWPPPSYRAAACFCASFRPTTYDWQVRSLFDAAAQVPGNATIGGMAADGRQRFRAAGLALWPDRDDWSPGHRSDWLRRLWDDCWGPAATDQARVVGPATPIGLTASGAAP
jgi:hypothetical protein